VIEEMKMLCREGRRYQSKEAEEQSRRGSKEGLDVKMRLYE
jgi:hypothetical protein